jgi:hypothetical protein
MKSTAVLGVVLALLGVIALAYQGFTYTTRKKAVDIGSRQITTEDKHTVPLPPIIGVAAIVGGLILIVAGNKGAHAS